MKLHEYQGAVAERVIELLRDATMRSPQYEGDILTNTYTIRSAVAEAILNHQEVKMKPSRKASRLIREFDQAAKNFEVMGCMPLEDWPEIKRNYKKAKKALREFVAQLESKI